MLFRSLSAKRKFEYVQRLATRENWSTVQFFFLEYLVCMVEVNPSVVECNEMVATLTTGINLSGYKIA